jgi:hypothetical protein
MKTLGKPSNKLSTEVKSFSAAFDVVNRDSYALSKQAKAHKSKMHRNFPIKDSTRLHQHPSSQHLKLIPKSQALTKAQSSSKLKSLFKLSSSVINFEKHEWRKLHNFSSFSKVYSQENLFCSSAKFQTFSNKKLFLPIIFHFKLHSTQERKAIKKINNKSFGIHSEWW